MCVEGAKSVPGIAGKIVSAGRTPKHGRNISLDVFTQEFAVVITEFDLSHLEQRHVTFYSC
jgi:hypothetical protein